MNQVLLYFGCIGQVGHYLFAEGERRFRIQEVTNLKDWMPGLNRRLLEPAVLDGLFVPVNAVFVPANAGYKVSTIPPVMIVSWIDNSVDARPGSHSTFIGYGYQDAKEILDHAMIKFPSVMRRQHRPEPESI